ncbi:hypothetical protein AAHB40_09945 [Bacillus velezensis]
MKKEHMDWLSSQTSRQFLSKRMAEGTKKSYTFKMDKDSVKKIKLEFEPPSNFSELSFIVIPEPDYKQESNNLDIASGLQENFTLRYIRKSRDEKRRPKTPKNN